MKTNDRHPSYAMPTTQQPGKIRKKMVERNKCYQVYENRPTS